MFETATTSLQDDVSIEKVGKDLENLQGRLLQQGRELFGEDFVLMALRKEDIQTKSPRQEFRRRQKIDKKQSKLKSGAKNVLLRFLEDREELLRLRVVSQAAQEKLQDKTDHLESKARKIQGFLNEIEKRRKVEAMNNHALLGELRKKLVSIERRQLRLSVYANMPDDDKRDAVIERHNKLQEKELGPSEDKRMVGEQGLSMDQTSFNRNLEQLARELRQIEIHMREMEV